MSSLMQKLGETFNNFQIHSCSILNLAEQWRSVQGSLGSIHNLLESRVKEVEAKEREVNMIAMRLDNYEKEVNLKLELGERSLSEKIEEVELRQKEVKSWLEIIEAQKRGIGEKSWEVDELTRVAKLREEGIEERCREVEEKEKDVKEREEVVSAREKGLDERGEKMALVESELRERICEWEGKEKENNDKLELTEREILMRCRTVVAKEKSLDLREKELKNSYGELELKEKGLDSREKELKVQGEVLETKEKEMCERNAMRRKELEVKERQLNEQLKEIHDRSKALDLVQKKAKEFSQGLKVKEEKLNKGLQGLQSKEKQIGERCKELEVKENGLRERSKELDGKETQMYRCMNAQDLRSKDLDDRNKGLEAKEIEVNEKYRKLEHKEKQIDELLKAAQESNEGQNGRHWIVDDEDRKDLSKDKKLDGQCEPLEEKHVTQHSVAQGDVMQESKDCQIHESNINDKALEFTEEIKQPESNLVVGNNKSENSAGFFHRMDGKSLQIYLNESVYKHGPMRRQITKILKKSGEPAKIVLDALEGFFPPHLSKNGVTFEVGTVRRSCLILLEILLFMKPFVSKAVRAEARKVAEKWRALMRVEGESEIVIIAFLLLLATYNLGPSRTFKAKAEAENIESMALQGVLKCILTFKLESQLRPEPLLTRLQELEKEKESRRAVRKRSASPSHSISTPVQQEKRPRLGTVQQFQPASPLCMPPCPPRPPPRPHSFAPPTFIRPPSDWSNTHFNGHSGSYGAAPPFVPGHFIPAGPPLPDFRDGRSWATPN